MLNRLEEIRPIFIEVLGNVAREIRPDTSAADIEGWDSFAHISIVVGIEEEYGVSFSTEELGKLSCVGDFVSLLETKLRKPGA